MNGIEHFEFGSLEIAEKGDHSRQVMRWGLSVALHAALVLALIALPGTIQQSLQPRTHIAAVSLISPYRPPESHPLPVPRRVRVVPPPVPPVIPAVHRAEFRPPPVKPLQVLAVAVAPPVPLPRPEPAPRIDLPAIDLPAHPAAKQEVFAANISTPAPARSAVPTVKVGGFGDPNGVQRSAHAANSGITLAGAGSFDSPQGSGSGSGRPGVKTVASAGFGGGSGASGDGKGGRGQGTVKAAGFNEFASNTAAPRAQRALAAAETPVEITFKPKPAYTSEAKAQRVEGEVELEVLFAATGQVQVLRVLRGLGFGLDESARAAANQIRFRAGTRDGAPVDMKGTVHIVFEIS